MYPPLAPDPKVFVNEPDDRTRKGTDTKGEKCSFHKCSHCSSSDIKCHCDGIYGLHDSLIDLISSADLQTKHLAFFCSPLCRHNFYRAFRVRNPEPISFSDNLPANSPPLIRALRV